MTKYAMWMNSDSLRERGWVTSNGRVIVSEDRTELEDQCRQGWEVREYPDPVTYRQWVAEASPR